LERPKSRYIKDVYVKPATSIRFKYTYISKNYAFKDIPKKARPLRSFV
jgi:hypothetical protein